MDIRGCGTGRFFVPTSAEAAQKASKTAAIRDWTWFVHNRVSIHDRSLSIGNRCRFGHWEGDSVGGAKGSGGIATHVERKSRVLVAAKLSPKLLRSIKPVSAMRLKPGSCRCMAGA